jgi:hypothetical protein
MLSYQVSDDTPPTTGKAQEEVEVEVEVVMAILPGGGDHVECMRRCSARLSIRTHSHMCSTNSILVTRHSMHYVCWMQHGDSWKDEYKCCGW